MGGSFAGKFGTATIAASASLSDAVVVRGARVVNILVGTWTDSAAITFQVQDEQGGTFYNLYDELGQEVQIPASTHNRAYPVPGASGFYAIKIRSGTSGSAVNQTASEQIVVVGVE